ncbi:MAG: nuclease-related domain-containing protein [Oscillospiraceae bacterium]
MPDWAYIVITVVLSVGVFAAMAMVLYRKNNPKEEKPQARSSGTGRAAGKMRSFARSNDFRFLGPATLESGGRTARLDALVIGYFGVLGLISLGYNGEIYGSATDKQWLQVSPDKTREYFDNPVLEAAADVRVIRDALFADKQKQVPVEVVCVFTDRRAQIAIPPKVGYLTMKSLGALLQKEKYLEDAGLDLDRVENAIRAAMV